MCTGCAHADWMGQPSFTSAAAWGFVLAKASIVFPLHISKLASKASGVSLAQLHPLLVARFTL